MSDVEEIRRLLERCTEEQRGAILDELNRIQPHPFAVSMKTSVKVILEALNRSSPLSLLGVRGLVGEATFVLEIAPLLKGWQDVTPPGEFPYDCALRDVTGIVTVQVKMQRRERGGPMLRSGNGVVEVQRTRGGKGPDGAPTRPYRFGEFDVLAVCMEPSHGRWNSFLYIPERWLVPRPAAANLIEILQLVSLVPNDIWTNDFSEVVRRFRSGQPRPS
jgi:hypothetical protein